MKKLWLIALFVALSGVVDQVPVTGTGSTASWRNLPVCTGAGKALTYDTSTQDFGCNTISGGSSPLTTKGDIYTFTTVDARKPVGADGLCLKALASETTGLEWGSCSAGGGISYAEAAAAVMAGF